MIATELIWNAIRSNPDLLTAFQAGSRIETVFEDGKLVIRTANPVGIDRRSDGTTVVYEGRPEGKIA